MGNYAAAIVLWLLLAGCGANASVVPPMTSTPGWSFELRVPSSQPKSVDVVLTRNADASIQLGNSQRIPTLALQCIGGNLTIALNFSTQVNFDYGESNINQFQLQFDDDPAEIVSVIPSINRDAFTFPEPEELLPSLLDHTTLRLKLDSSQTTFSTAFNLTELDKPVRALLVACHLDNIQVDGTFVLTGCTSVETFQALFWTLRMQSIVDRFTSIRTPADAEAVRNTIADIAYPSCLEQARQYVLNSVDAMHSGMQSSGEMATFYKNMAIGQMYLFLEEVERLVSQ